MSEQPAAVPVDFDADSVVAVCAAIDPDWNKGAAILERRALDQAERILAALYAAGWRPFAEHLPDANGLLAAISASYDPHATPDTLTLPPEGMYRRGRHAGHIAALTAARRYLESGPTPA